MLRDLIEYYMILSTMYFSLILIFVLLGIDVDIKPFKYSLNNILDYIDKVKGGNK